MDNLDRLARIAVRASCFITATQWEVFSLASIWRTTQKKNDKINISICLLYDDLLHPVVKLSIAIVILFPRVSQVPVVSKSKKIK